MADEELAKDLGLLAALTIGIGTMIGAGIFVLPGAAASMAGPLSVVAFVIGGVIALFTALSASELGTAMPRAGGAYFYINQGLGPLFGSIAGWGNWMGLAFASAFYCIGFGSYVGILFAIPDVVVGPFALSGAQTGGLLAGVFFVGVNYIGAKETGAVQNVIVITLLLILVSFVVGGVFRADVSTLTPFAPQGWGVLFPTTALLFVSYLGFVQITTVAEEIRNPGRNLPIAVVGSVLVVTAVYALVILVLMGVINWTEVAGNETAVADAGGIILGGVGVVLLTLGGLLATASSANASIMASSRINFAMGRDKLVSDWLNEIHEKFATPHRSIGVTGFLIILFILIGDIQILAKAGSVLHLIVYGLLNVALIVFREADVPHYEPEFTVPLYPITPAVGAILSFGLIAFMAPLEILLSLLFVIGGVLWYVGYARRHTTHEGLLSQFVFERAEQLPDLAVSAAVAARPDTAIPFRVLVPLANPRTEKDLISLASTVAKANEGIVHAIHIVQVPDQTPLDRGAAHIERIDAESTRLLEAAKIDAETYGVPIETTTVVSHRSFEEVFDSARRHDADMVVMGWGGVDRPWSAGSTLGPLDELTHNLPCDFVVLKDRGLDPGRVLVPTAGGPDSDLSAAVARYLRDVRGSEVTLLHVVHDDDRRAAGHAFLGEWADDHSLGDANLLVDTSGDVEGAIARAANDATLVVIGATERGLLSRLVRGSLVYDVINTVDCSVILAERPSDRSLRERLFGRFRR